MAELTDSPGPRVAAGRVVRPARPLGLADVLDQRAYERARDAYRAEVIALKRRRRVAVGPLVSAVFECFDTVRFQVHEMARAEHILTDEGIQSELDTYNGLLPVAGELSATVFLELTTPEDLRRWLPELVGVEGSLVFELSPVGESGPGFAVRGVPEAAHAEALTRDEVTAAVHYVRFPFSPAEVDAFARGRAALAVRHRAYQAVAELADATRDELLADLRGECFPLPLP
ncbi:MAG TPA: DUF3501 family protein [Acidimicrobiales bacterium]|jgi:hypothetical protein